MERRAITTKVNELIKKYDGDCQKIKDALLEEEMEEADRAYASGYLDAILENKDGEEKYGEMTIEDCIRGVRTKYCEDVLEILNEEGKMYHGDLAERLEITPSAMNVIIKKMQESPIPLIDIKKAGKFTLYYLSDEAKQYFHPTEHIAEYLPVTDKKDEQDEGNSIFLALQHFVDQAGDGWRDRLNILAEGNREGTSFAVLDCYEKFIDQAAVAIRDRSAQWEEMKQFINNEVLVYLIESYVEMREICSAEVVRMLKNAKSGKERGILKAEMARALKH